jgi:hypothetical protein
MIRYDLRVNTICDINHEVSKTRRNSKIKYLILQNFVYLRDFVSSWQKQLVYNFVIGFLITSQMETFLLNGSASGKNSASYLPSPTGNRGTSHDQSRA